MDQEIRAALGKEEYDKLNDESIKKVLDDEFNLVKCKCGNMLEVIKGDII